MLGATILFYAGGPTDAASQVVELGSAHATSTEHLNILDTGRVQEEGPLDANPVRDTADGERLLQAGPTPGEHHPLERLHAFPIPLDDPYRYLHHIARPELRHILFQLRFRKLVSR
jgi:hypothetical protein